MRAAVAVVAEVEVGHDPAPAHVAVEDLGSLRSTSRPTGSSDSSATPNLRTTSSPAFRLVPSVSRNVDGNASRWSVSLAAIHTWRAESGSSGASRPASTRCQRTSESATVQPTHEAVWPWSAIGCQGAAQVDARPAAARRRGGPRRRRSRFRSRASAGRPRSRLAGLPCAGVVVEVARGRRERLGGGRRRAGARARARSSRPPRPVRRRSPGRSGPWPAGTSWPADRRARPRRGRRIRARVRGG